MLSLAFSSQIVTPLKGAKAMPDSKITLRIGAIEFSAEGESTWVAEQFDKAIEKAPQFIALAPPSSDGDGQQPMGADASISQVPLAMFLRDKEALENQTRKFLATAAWLEAKGSKRLKPGDVSKALKSANQTKVGNPSQALANNVSQGYCERDGEQFFVTENGTKSLES